MSKASLNGLAERFTFGITTDPAVIRAARRLQAEWYRRMSYVLSEDIDADGLIREPFAAYSVYYVARCNLTGRVVGSVRKIKFNPHGFPAITKFELYDGWPDLYAPGLKPDHSNMVELSALVVDWDYVPRVEDIAKGLYKQIWQDELRAGEIRYWLGSVDHRLYDSYINRLHFAFVQIGKEAKYMGSITIPAVLDLRAQNDHMMSRDPDLARLFLEGLEEELIPEFRVEVPFDLGELPKAAV